VTLDWPLLYGILTIVGIGLFFVLRMMMRRYSRRVIEDANRSLRLPIPGFALLDRKVLMSRLLDHKDVKAAIEKRSGATGVPIPALQSQCNRYAKEIVPAFRATFYFRVGYWLARRLLLSHYRVHSRLLDEAAIDDIDRHASAVLVSNHRSNMDVLLLNYLASHRSTLMHAAGEWARLWPLQHLVRMAGNYVVDRDAVDPLYHTVLKAFVQMATSEGAHLAIFPEGELTRDGNMGDSKFGLLSYVATASRSGSSHDVVFVPVGVNFDYVPEEKRLVGIRDTAFREHSPMYLFFLTVRATLTMLLRVLRPKRAQYGNACASFGKPVSLKAWQAEHGVDPADPTKTRQWVTALGEEIISEVGRIIPTLPVHVLAILFLREPDRVRSRAELTPAVRDIIYQLDNQNLIVCVPDDDLDNSIDNALRGLRRRNLVVVDDAGAYGANAKQLRLLNYLANSVRHNFERVVSFDNDQHPRTCQRGLR